MRANDEDLQQTESGQAQHEAVAPTREPYTPPVIEKFPPMGNVTFGTNTQGMLSMTLLGA